MKTWFKTLLCSVLALSACGQSLPQTDNTASDASGPASQSGPTLLKPPGTNGSRVLQSAGPNSRTWLVSRPATNTAVAGPPGRSGANAVKPGGAPPKTSAVKPGKVVELASGLNYYSADAKAWLPSVPAFEVLSNAFVARQVQQQVSIEPDLRVAGAVSLTTPQGVIESTPTAIVLYDEVSGNSLMIGTITNCQGVLMSSNRVGFANAFCGVCGDVVYTISRGSFHQDVVITGKIDPAQYGFPTSSTRIQIMTELYRVPDHQAVQRPLAIERNQAVRQRMATPDLIDSELHFGSLVFGLGHAYAAPAPANTNGSSAVVAKEVVTDTSSGRTFLVESVRYASIAQGLAALPDCQGGTAAALPRQPGSGPSAYAAIPALPASPESAGILPASARATKPAGKDAGAPSREQAALGKRPEVVIDYVAVVDSGTTVFQGDTTYLVEGEVDIYNPVVFEGNVVIKYAGLNGGGPGSLHLFNTVTFNSSMYRPAVFTAMDDEWVGATCSGFYGYTGDPYNNGPYASPALFLQNPESNIPVNNAHFRFAAEAVHLDTSWSGAEQTLTCSHCQFFNCLVGCGAGGYGATPSLNLRNCLMSGITNALTLSSYYGAFQCADCTFDTVATLVAAAPGSVLTNQFDNCILANVNDLGVTDPLSGGVNGFYQTTTFGYYPRLTYENPFLTVGGGAYYLNPTNSTGPYWLVAADTNVVPEDLLPQLRERTTYPPVDLDLSWESPMGQVMLNPVVPRDGNALALGYHYDKLDYFIYGNYAYYESPVVIGAGTVVGCAGYGLSVNNSTLTIQGTATSNCWIVESSVSQEQPWNCYGGTIRPTYSQLSANFTQWSLLNEGACAVFAYGNSTASINLSKLFLGGGASAVCADDSSVISINHTELYGGPLLLWPYWYRPMALCLTNCLLERVSMDMQETPFCLRNCTFHQASLNLVRSSWLSWSIEDSLFDDTTVSISDSLNGDPGCTMFDYNAYLDGADRLLPWATNDCFVTNFNWQAGPLGNYYLPPDSTLTNAGSTTAAQAGLYHFTTQTNQVKEGFSQVDIGYHYVALDANGNPVDTDGDGVPDCLADANGNGLYDPGEIPWFLTPPIILLQPVGQTVYAGANVGFGAFAVGTKPFGYQWLCNGTNTGITTPVLSLGNIQPAQEGNYSVVISNAYGSCTSSNAALTVSNAPASSSPIHVSSFAPAAAPAGASVTLTGWGFSSIPTNNVVYFGGVQAPVLSAATNLLVVVVPSGATYAPTTVTAGGLTACGDTPFLLTFAGTGPISASSLTDRVDLPAGANGDVRIADLDGDGKPDLVRADSDGNVYVYRNVSTSGLLMRDSFASAVQISLGGATPGGCVLADLDGDGRLDIVVVSPDANSAFVVQNLSTPGVLSFGSPVQLAVGRNPVAVAVSDLDGDGKPDLMVVNYDDSNVSIFRNIHANGLLSTNSFAEQFMLDAWWNPHSIAVCDLDGDGRPEIAVGTEYGTGVFGNLASPGSLGTNSFTPGAASFAGGSYSLDIGDFDGDGKPDVVAGSYYTVSTLSLIRNTSVPGSIGVDSRTEFETGYVMNLALGDINGDGKPDLAVVTDSPIAISLYQNNSTPGVINAASLSQQFDLPGASNPQAVAVADLDGDGRPDVVVGGGGCVTIYQNLSPAQPPVIVSQPASLSVIVGSNATFNVVATGLLPLAYQWEFNGTNIPGATASSYTRTSAQPPHAGQYSVVVTNVCGSTTSSNALLIVNVPPAIIIQPSDAAAGLGEIAAFSVVASGTTPLAYQWRREGANLVGATNPALVLLNVQLTNAGHYSVLITNVCGTVLSRDASLTVLPPPCVPQPPGLISWWPGEGNANDVMGLNPGSLSNGVTFAAGEVGQAFKFNGTNQFVSIPDSASLRPTNLTIECWVRPTSLSGVRTIVAKPYGTGSSYKLSFNGSILFAGVTGAYFLSYSWPLGTNSWHHVAYTIDRPSYTETLYVDGASVASSYLSLIIPYDTSQVGIGAYYQTGTIVYPFSGQIDEVSLYNRALSPTEIQNIYLAGASGKCPGGSGPVDGPAVTAPTGDQLQFLNGQSIRILEPKPTSQIP